MKKSRFTETQIISILSEADAGMKVQEVCRKHGISPATPYQRKSKYGGLDASELTRIKELEAENAELKRRRHAHEYRNALDGAVELLDSSDETKKADPSLKLVEGSA